MVDRLRQSAEKKRRFFLGDPSLKRYSGHCLEYLQSLARPLNARGHAVHYVGNRDMDPVLARDLPATCAFTYWCDERAIPPGVDFDTPRGRQMMRIEHGRAVKADLERLDGQFSFVPNDVLVLNTFRHWQLGGIIDWVEGLGRSRAPHIILILHFTAFPVPGIDRGDSDIYREAFIRIENSSLRDRFVMMADSDELVHEYKAITSLDFLLAPIPHCARDNVADAGGETPAKVKMAYVGEARHNKGFHLLPWAIKGLLQGPYRDRVHFNIQSFCDDRKNPFYQKAMAKMPSSSEITFYPDQLNEDDYHAFLESADVILAPYLLENYYVQTSGIYGEAVGMGKPAIVPRGSWMATQVRKFGGGVVFPPGDPQALLDACMEMVSNYPKYRAEAQTAAVAWRAFHTPERLVDMIEAMTGCGAQ